MANKESKKSDSPAKKSAAKSHKTAPAQPQKLEYPKAPKIDEFKSMEIDIDDSPKEDRNLMPVVIAAVLVFGLFVWFITGPQAKAPDKTEVPDETASYLYQLSIGVTKVGEGAEISYDGVDWNQMTAESPVPQGAYIRTPDDSSVILSVDDGLTVIRLDENAQLYVANTNSVNLIFEPMQGAIYYQFNLTANRTYGVDLVNKILKTETGTFASYTAGGETSLYVISGGAWVNDKTLSAGEVYSLDKGVQRRDLPGFLKRFVNSD